MTYADAYGEFEIDDDEIVDDDYQGHLVAEAHRIVAGESDDPPTVEMLAALIDEIGITRQLVESIRSGLYDDIPF